MRKEMIRLMNSQDDCKRIGNLMRKRAMECFNIYHLDNLFYLTIKDIMNGVFDESKVDMTNYKI